MTLRRAKLERRAFEACKGLGQSFWTRRARLACHSVSVFRRPFQPFVVCFSGYPVQKGIARGHYIGATGMNDLLRVTGSINAALASLAVDQPEIRGILDKLPQVVVIGSQVS